MWQYRIILFELSKDGLLGDKYVDDEEMERTLNLLGEEAWELVNVSLLQDGLLAFLKKAVHQEKQEKQEKQERVIKEPIAVTQAVSFPPVRHRPAPSAPKESVVNPPYEPEIFSSPEPHRKRAIREDDLDAIGRIKATREDDPDSIGRIKIS